MQSVHTPSHFLCSTLLTLPAAPGPRQRETRFEGAASRAFQAPHTARNVHLLVHFHPRRTTTPAEVALDAFPGVEAKMKQAEPVEEGQQAAQRAENPAPGSVKEEGGGNKTKQDRRFDPAHGPAVPGQQALDGVRHARFKRSRGTKPANRD